MCTCGCVCVCVELWSLAGGDGLLPEALNMSVNVSPRIRPTSLYTQRGAYRFPLTTISKPQVPVPWLFLVFISFPQPEYAPQTIVPIIMQLHCTDASIGTTCQMAEVESLEILNHQQQDTEGNRRLPIQWEQFREGSFFSMPPPPKKSSWLNVFGVQKRPTSIVMASRKANSLFHKTI